MEGVVKKVTDRGYGFISVEGEEDDIFFHANSLVDVSFDELREGDEVSFEVQESDKGPNAVDVEMA